MLTCEDFAATWAVSFPRPDPRTNANNHSMAKHFGRYFGSRPLDSLTRADAYKFSLAHPTAVRYARSLFTDAINAGFVLSSPFTGLRVASGSSIGRCFVDLPPFAEVYNLERAAPAELKGAILFAATTGLRLGEQLGVRRSDFENDTLLMETQLDPSGHRKPLKGQAGARRVFLCPEALEAVSGLLDGPDEDSLLWPIHRRTHFSAWDRARKAVGVTFAWHMLRHMALNRLVEAGAHTRDVAFLAGHRDDTQVRTRYARHVDEDAAVNRLRELVA